MRSALGLGLRSQVTRVPALCAHLGASGGGERQREHQHLHLDDPTLLQQRAFSFDTLLQAATS